MGGPGVGAYCSTTPAATVDRAISLTPDLSGFSINLRQRDLPTVRPVEKSRFGTGGGGWGGGGLIDLNGGKLDNVITLGGRVGEV